MGVETTKKKLQTFGDINLLGTIWKTHVMRIDCK